jgi:peptidoglycan-N-acetylglucosamine deacetylase
MIYWGTPRILMKWFKNFEWHGNRSEKTIFLTFDDGPTPGVTEEVLNLLDKYDAKATFFCLGRNVERHPEIYQDIINRGHSVGNHTYSHLKGWKTSSKVYIQDTNMAQVLVQSKLFRPPYGRIRTTQSRYLLKFYRIIMWDVLSHDYNQSLPKKLSLRSVIRSTHNGSIVVFHDSLKARDTMFYVVPRFLEHFREKGYTFRKID